MVAKQWTLGEDGYIVSDMEPLKTDDTVQFFKDEIIDGAAVYSVYLKKVRYHTPLDDVVSGVRRSVSNSDLRTAHLQWRLEEIRTIRAGNLPQLVAAITTEPSGELDSTYVNTLLATYRTFTTPSNLFDEIKTRYRDVGQDQTLQQQLREGCQRSLRTVLSVWMDSYPDDFREPLEYPIINSIYQFALDSAFDNELAQKASELLDELKGNEDSHIASSGLVDDLIKSLRFAAVTNVRSSLNRLLRPPLDLLTVPARIFAEQLTFIDAELFKRVVPYHCLGAIWSRRADKKCAVLPVSVFATVDQFNAVSYRVIATVLKYPYTFTAERASFIEKWIDVAQECRVLKNFSSLKAIIAGLQSHAVFRLQSVWEQVSREKMALYAELADIFSENDNQCLWRELLNREGTAKFADPETMNTIRRRDRQSSATSSRSVRKLINFDLPAASTMQGTVPYLGTFLTDLTMVDTAHKDMTKDGLINFEKRRKEFELMAQIRMLQSTASLYRISPEPAFFDWFYNIRVYDESESNELSLEIMPSENSVTIDRRTHRRNASLGFFTPRHRAGLENVQFPRRGSQASLNSKHEDEDDSHSVASMHELYSSTPKPEFRHSISMSSMKSLSSLDVGSKLLSPYQSPEMIAVKVYLQISENLQTNHYKSILLSNTDHANVVLRNTLAKYGISGKPEDFTIVQTLPDKTVHLKAICDQRDFVEPVVMSDLTQFESLVIHLVRSSQKFLTAQHLYHAI